MSVETRASGLLDDLSRLSRQQWLLRLGAVPPTVLFLLLAHEADGRFDAAVVALVLLLSTVVVVVPDSGAALGLVLALVGLWLLRVPEQLGAWTVLAGLDLLLLHLTVTLASYGPPSTVLQRDLLSVWTRRALLLAAGTVGTWVAARLLARAGHGPGAAPMAAGLVVLLVWSGYLTVRLAGGRSE